MQSILKVQRFAGSSVTVFISNEPPSKLPSLPIFWGHRGISGMWGITRASWRVSGGGFYEKGIINSGYIRLHRPFRICRQTNVSLANTPSMLARFV